MKHRILISLGTNINRTFYARRGLTRLTQSFAQVTCSRMFESEAVGFPGSPFYNCVIQAFTHKDIAGVVQELKTIERENGRTHSEKKYCSRTLDLDLLTFDDAVTCDPVVLPREEILLNAFVLQPLAELVPNDIHPVVDKSYLQLWQNYDKTAQKLWPIDFTWSEF
ncbi:2-amino-4-hydroxy-6-hydroxymethyldihydropteridine diphosphokinase [Alteromonas sp. C1M14]|uniref:2-amino-4-hydroxy-6- hydroxymethyldihydropteridine diphosphokinase n=1 Tax=Alteromonas sp. C1M14 TaxID=2841567 RepID=UPI001C089785|nr:2-amino-4-hydroxy-6-hydroxymethyldihydropteridine diphosphokinase [Alteromonas sp. C1M14]MBU2977624.1 2-amino-4-hydroxy-6-hydroxymethyldihydropteridine diphosphokinase [Alteromonas sp. C1M14]